MATDVEKEKMEKFKEIPSEIVSQVLTYLPIKALNRFKCVSTSWSLMIFQHRPYGCILVNISSNSMKKGLFFASIRVGMLQHEKIQDLEPETFVHQLSLPYLVYENITPVVNGLACLYTDHQVSLFNISTCEIMNLPSSSLNSARKIWYALGFDPIDNVYKLLKLSSIRKRKVTKFSNWYNNRDDDDDDEYELFCETLALKISSTSTWKKEEKVISGYSRKFSSVNGQSYFVNGVIFWKCYGKEGECIISFDVHKEKFFSIECPPMAPTRRFGQFEGHLALSYTYMKSPSYDSWVMDIWVLEDHQTSLWNKITIDLPVEVEKHFNEATPIGNFPSGELLLVCFERQKMEGTFFTYDAIKRKFTKLMIELPRSLALAHRTQYPAHISCLFDDMSNDTPLNYLF